MKEEYQRELGLKSQINAMIQRYRHTLLVSSILKLGVWCGSTTVLFCCLDYFLPLPIQGRLGLTTLLYACFAGMISFILIRPFIKRLTYERMAWMLEEKCQSFDESLVSALNFEKQKNQNVSELMKEKVVDDAEASLHQYHPLVLFRINKKWLALALTAGMIYLGLFLFFAPHSNLLLKRIFMPSQMDARPGSFVLEEIFPESHDYVEGNEVEFKVRVLGRSPEKVMLRLRQNSERLIELEWNQDEKVFESIIEGLVGDVYYRFEAENVMSGERFLKYLPRPKIEDYHITYTYPEYTGLPVKKMKSRSGDLQALVGTKVQIRAVANKRLSSHTLNWIGNKELKQYPSPGTLEIIIDKSIQSSGNYHLQLQDVDEITSDLSPEYSITAIQDQAPKVTWLAMDKEIYLTPNSKLLCQWIAEDDFGITAQKLILQHDQKILTSEDVKVVEKSLALDLSKFSLADGSTVDLILQVSDALQTTDSEVIKLHIVDDEKVKFALPFVSKCESALEKLEKLNLQFSQVQNTIELIPEIDEKSQEFEKSERAHQLGVQKIRLQRLAAHMGEFAADIEDLRRMAFFPKSEAALSLETRYLEHLELNEFFPLFEEPDLSEPLEKLILSTQLNKNLIRALSAKAQNHHDRFEMVRHQKLKQALSEQVIMGLREKYLKPVLFLNELQTEKKSRGLNTLYFKDRKWYPESMKKGFPQNVERKFISSKLDFHNLAALGWDHHQTFSAIWYGYLKAPKKGHYKFFLNSDDGSRCYINGQLVVKNDGDHGMQEKQGGLHLEQGYHYVEIVFYNSSSEAGLQWFWQPPDEGKYIVPDYVLQTRLSEHEMKAFWETSLTHKIEWGIHHHQPIEEAMRDIERQLPKDSFDLNMAVAQLKENEESAWKKARQVQNFLETLSEDVENAPVADTQKQAANLLAEIVEDKDEVRLQEFNEILNESKRKNVKGREYLSPEIQPLLQQLEKDELSHLELALSQLTETASKLNLEDQEASASLAKIMANLEKAKSKVLDKLLEQLENRNQKQEIAGDLAVLESIEKAKSENNDIAKPSELKLKSLKQDLEKAHQLAVENEAYQKNQLSLEEQQTYHQKVEGILQASQTLEDYQQVAMRDHLQSLQTQTDQMKQASETLEKHQNHDFAKALAERAKVTTEEIKRLDPQSQFSLPEENQLNPHQKVNLDHLSNQIHQLEDRLNRAHEQQIQRRSAQQQAGIERAKTQELLNKINRDQLDHQQDQAYANTQASLNQELRQTRDSLYRLADRMHGDKSLQKEIREMAKTMSPVSDRENQLPHYKRSEQDRLREMSHAGLQVENELKKSASAEAQAMQNSLKSSLQAASEGRYDDARGSLEALQKDALALAQSENTMSELESMAASNAMKHLQDSERQIQVSDKPSIQKARDLTQKQDYVSASKILEPILKKQQKNLERLEQAEKIADAQHVEKHALDAAEQDMKQGRPALAAMKMAKVSNQQKLARELLQLEHERQALMDTLEEKQISESNPDFQKDLHDAIEDGRRGKFKELHRELSRSKGQWDAEMKQAEAIQKKGEQLAKAIDQAQKDQRQDIAKGKSKLKDDLGQELKQLKSQMAKTKDQNEKNKLNQQIHHLNEEIRLSQSHDLNVYKHHLQHQLRGVTQAQQAHDELQIAQRYKEASKPAFDLDEAQKQKLNQAKQALSKAQQPLNQGKASQESTGQFNVASESLASMVAQMDQQRLAELQKAKSQSAQALAAQAQLPNQDDESPTEGSQYQFEPDESQVLLNSSDWNGLEGALKEQGGQGTENIYDDYFNRANNRYLQKILKASRQWK